MLLDKSGEFLTVLCSWPCSRGLKGSITPCFSEYFCTPAILGISDFACELRSLVIEQEKCYILEVHMGVYMAPRSQYEHIVFPRLRLGVLWSFQRCLCQTVWRAAEGLASPRLLGENACNMCFLQHGNQPLPTASISPHPPRPPTSRRITGRNWRLDPSLVCTTAIST